MTEKNKETKEDKNLEEESKSHEEENSDPTRYGDWELKGRCIDF